MYVGGKSDYGLIVNQGDLVDIIRFSEVESVTAIVKSRLYGIIGSTFPEKINDYVSKFSRRILYFNSEENKMLFALKYL